MSLLKRVIAGFIVFLGFAIAGVSVQKKEKNLQQEIKQMKEEIPQEPIAQPFILPIDEVEGRIIESWLKKGEIFNLVVNIEESTAQEMAQIGKIKGKNLIIKVDIPKGIENEVLRWVDGTRKEYPMVLVNGIKISGGEKEEVVEVSMIIYGS